ncbi:hypothetical protein GF319_05690 [Candidatus Bathyarchaeota archaeon]|nr:hypothetical protein [Candidatus Bathyarchaeota archaeon]
MGSFIKILDISLENGEVIKIDYDYSKNLGRHFRKNSFKVKYSDDISSVNRGILGIPALAGLIGIAWLTGSDVFIDSLDEDYYHSLMDLMTFFQERHRSLGFETKIHTRLIKNKPRKQGVGLLFSGGVDSLYSYYSNKGKEPELFTVFGSEIPVGRVKFIEKVMNTNKDFAERHGLKIHFIETDYLNSVNGDYITSQYFDYMGGYSYYEAFCIGIFLTGVCAPITIDRVNRLLLSSGVVDLADNMYGSSPRLDEKIGWGGLHVIHEGGGVSRYEKIRYLSQHLKREAIALRVCNFAPKYLDRLNCSKCEKCYRNMLILLYHGLDPSKHGFNYLPEKLSKLKNRIISGSLLKEDDIPSWKSLQRENLIHSEDDMLNEFTDWFTNFNLDSVPRATRMPRFYLRIFSYLPLRVGKMVRKIYHKRIVKM